MANCLSRTKLMRVWFVTFVVVMACSVALGATFTTSALLLVLGVTPAAVMRLIGFGAPPRTVAEVLYAVNKQT